MYIYVCVCVSSIRMSWRRYAICFFCCYEFWYVCVGVGIIDAKCTMYSLNLFDLYKLS